MNPPCLTGVGAMSCNVSSLNTNADEDTDALNIHISSGIGDMRWSTPRIQVGDIENPSPTHNKTTMNPRAPVSTENLNPPNG